MAKTRGNFAQQFESLAGSIGLLHRQASNVSAGSCETGDEAGSDRIGRRREDDRDD
jgi:hypothetical protein